MGPIAWAKAVRRLMEVRGLKRGVKRNRHAPREDTLAGLAKELGVSERTARRRFDLLDALGPYPKLVQMVDAEEISAADAKKLANSSTHAQRIERGELTAAEALKELRTQRNGKSDGSGEEPESAMPEKSVGTGPSSEDDQSGDRADLHGAKQQNDEQQELEEPTEVVEEVEPPLQESSFGPENTPDETPEPDQPESANPTDCGTDTEPDVSPTPEGISDCIAQAVIACLQQFHVVSLTLIDEAYQQAWPKIQSLMKQQSIKE